MTILENFVWKGDNDMKKTVLLIVPLLFLFLSCEDKETATPDTTPPMVTITSPQDGTTILISLQELYLSDSVE